MSTDTLLKVDFTMKMTVSLDGERLAEAKKLTKIKETSRLVQYAVKRMAAFEAARYLATLGGSQPGISVTPRRRIELRDE